MIMTREEQIRQASIEYTIKDRPMCIGGDAFSEIMDEMNRNHAFEEGAKWADEHPNKDLKRLIRKAKSYDKLVSKGFVNIEKVCEWLNDNMKNYAAFDSDMIKDLKKAME
jgi:hypothetical protein